MGESNPHSDANGIIHICLEAHLASRKGIRVFMNLNCYYRNGPRHPKTGSLPYVSPDVMLVRPSRPRPRGVQLRDDGHVHAEALGLDGGAHPCAPGADDDHIVTDQGALRRSRDAASRVHRRLCEQAAEPQQRAAPREVSGRIQPESSVAAAPIRYVCGRQGDLGRVRRVRRPVPGADRGRRGPRAALRGGAAGAAAGGARHRRRAHRRCWSSTAWRRSCSILPLVTVIAMRAGQARERGEPPRPWRALAEGSSCCRIAGTQLLVCWRSPSCRAS